MKDLEKTEALQKNFHFIIKTNKDIINEIKKQSDLIEQKEIDDI
jgi:hypothetical protein